MTFHEFSRIGGICPCGGDDFGDGIIDIADYDIVVSGHPGEKGTHLSEDDIIVSHETKEIWIDI